MVKLEQVAGARASMNTAPNIHSYTIPVLYVIIVILKKIWFGRGFISKNIRKNMF